jgi:hypothetical protein
VSTNDPDAAPQWSPPPAQPPPPPPPPPSGYGFGSGLQGQPGSYPAPQTTEGTAIVALVASIASFVICPVVPAVVALVLIPGARRKIVDSGGRLTGESLLTAAKWISWIHLGLVLLAVVALVALIAITALGSSTSADYGLVVAGA